MLPTNGSKLKTDWWSFKAINGLWNTTRFWEKNSTSINIFGNVSKRTKRKSPKCYLGMIRKIQRWSASSTWVASACLAVSVWSNSLRPHQAPLSMRFPGKNTGVGCHALLLGIFLTQGLNTCLVSPALQMNSLLLGHWASQLQITVV